MMGFHVATLDATLVIGWSLCGGTISPRFAPESFIDFNLRLVAAFSPEK